MGFAPVAATAILLIAGLATFATYSVEQDAADDTKRQAGDTAAQRQAERSRTSMSVTATQYQNGPNRLAIDLTNDGATVIETGGIDVVLDGEVRTQDISSLLVEGESRAYWSPHQSVQIRIDQVTSQPARVAVIAHNGAAVYAVV